MKKHIDHLPLAFWAADLDLPGAQDLALAASSATDIPLSTWIQCYASKVARLQGFAQQSPEDPALHDQLLVLLKADDIPGAMAVVPLELRAAWELFSVG